MDEREKKKVCSAFMFVADPISCSLILAATKVPQIHISTVPQFRPKLTLHIDLHYFDVQKGIHTQSKKETYVHCISSSSINFGGHNSGPNRSRS